MKETIRDQYKAKVSQYVHCSDIKQPKEGWIRTLRKALGMSGPQLARRLGISYSQESQMERMESEDRITLKQLRRVAESLDAHLVYALIPHKPVDEILRQRAKLKAVSIVNKTDAQMRLEDQQLSNEKLQSQIDFEMDRLIREMPRDLWED